MVSTLEKLKENSSSSIENLIVEEGMDCIFDQLTKIKSRIDGCSVSHITYEDTLVIIELTLNLLNRDFKNLQQFVPEEI
jgi:hypothetical protein